MSFTHYFKLSSYCLITSGFVAISATGAVDILSLLLFGGTLATSWFVDTRRLRQRMPAWLLNSIVLSYLPIYLLDYLVLSRSFVVSTVRLIFFVSAVKLITRSSDRDYVYLYLISFAELLAASTLTVDFTFAISLLVFLLSGISTLVLFEMRRSNARAQSHGEIQPVVLSDKRLRGTGLEIFSSFPAGAVCWISLGMTFSILLLAVPLFFIIPRVSLGIYNRPAGKTQMVSGFSQKVELGMIGTIKESDTVVMRVKLGESAGRLPSDLKWRGIALDYYDGRSWSRSGAAMNRVYPQGEYFKLEDYTRNPNLLLQKYFLEALSTEVVFACHRVLAVSSELRSLQRDPGNSLFTLTRRFSKIRYTALSDVTRPDPSLISIVPPRISDEMRETYLQLPALDPRIAELARRVSQDSQHPYRKAQLLESYLKSNYGYSLELRGSPNSKDPLAMFLFDVRKGHCEYFAAAMTVMLRQLGIAARLVNGFRAGEYNPLGDAWVVRQYDAHSWVEAYYPPYGWVEFDPTPPDPLRHRSEFLRIVSNFLDAIDLWWSDEVVNYTSWNQYALIRSTRAHAVEFQQKLNLLFSHLYSKLRARMDHLDLRGWFDGWNLAILTVFSLAALFIIRSRSRWIRAILRGIRRGVFRQDAAGAIVSFYAEAQDLLRTRGMVRSPSQTPLEFVQTLEPLPVYGPLAALTEMYNRIRFGSRADAEDLSQAGVLLRALRDALKSSAHQAGSVH